MQKIESENETLNFTESNRINYLDTLIEGKETFTSYENIIKNFGQSQKIKKLLIKMVDIIMGILQF